MFEKPIKITFWYHAKMNVKVIKWQNRNMEQWQVKLWYDVLMEWKLGRNRWGNPFIGKQWACIWQTLNYYLILIDVSYLEAYHGECSKVQLIWNSKFSSSMRSILPKLDYVKILRVDSAEILQCVDIYVRKNSVAIIFWLLSSNYA